MVNSKYILTFGLTPHQQQTLADTLKEPRFELVTAQSAKQIIYGDYFALIIHRDSIPQEETESLQIFFSEIDGASTTKIFITSKEDALTESTNSILFSCFKEILPKVCEILKKAYDRAKRQESLTKSMSISFFILNEIIENPGISTRAIAEKLKRSEAAVKRYIEELCMAGKTIYYDLALNGWKLKD